MDAIARLLRGSPPNAHASIEAWLRSFDDGYAPSATPTPFSEAVRGGVEANRLGYAFTAGYHAALQALASRAGTVTRPFPRRLCLAVTESDGGHPRAITASLTRAGEGFLLRGEKTFATLASVADELLVAVTCGEPQADGTKDIRLVRVRRGARGTTSKDRAALPFAPEIPHAKVTFEDVVVAEGDVLPGDGFTRYLKPFRTLEDIHVLGAAVAYVTAIARERRLEATIEAGTSLLAALELLAANDPAAPEVHIALAGTWERARAVAHALAKDAVASDEVLTRLARDLPLVEVASSARAKRTSAALRALGLRSSGP